MIARRLGFALVAALVISVAITYVFYVRIAKNQSANKAPTRHVIAAGSALQPGIAITEENLTEINWPTNVSMEGLIDKKEDAIGHVPMIAIDAKQPIMKNTLASSGNFGLAAKIPAGMRAASVKTNEVMNIAGFIFPGSRVDVLVTLRGDNSVASSVTRTVLQNVQVLATGAKTDPDPNGKPENVSVVTLLVTPEESEKLALAQNQTAQNQGSIHFVLRNGGDTARADTAPVDMSELSGVPRKAPKTESAHKKPVTAPKLPEPYTVETLAGTKVTVAKFPGMSN